MKNFCEDLFFFFGEHLRFVSLVLGLGLEHSCPWPRERLSSERLSLALALASDFFVSLALASSLVSSTPPLIKWLVHQARPCLRAKISAVKLEEIGPEEKDKELDVLHLEHVAYIPAPPGPKREGTDPSVHTWISAVVGSN